MDDVLRPARCQRHVQGIEHELGVQAGGHRPADDAAAERIECDGQVEEAGPRRNVGDIGHPQHVRARRLELAVHPVERARRGPVAHRGFRRLAADHAGQAHLLH